MLNNSKVEVNQLRHYARKMIRELGLLNEAYCEIGVTLAERHLLIELEALKEATAKEIAQRLIVDKSTISRLIARAVKKGYVQSEPGKSDKRSRLLSLTSLGKKTLNAFERLAFEQTQNALGMLDNEEVVQVYRGVKLYAQGLEQARGIKENTLDKTTQNQLRSKESFEEIEIQLKELGYRLRSYQSSDYEALYSAFHEEVHTHNLLGVKDDSIEEFQCEFLTSNSLLYTCTTLDGEIVGGFCLRQNFHERSTTVANAAYLIALKDQGKGIGKLLVKASLILAQREGFKSIIFNKVLARNIHALRLYQKVGFEVIGSFLAQKAHLETEFEKAYILQKNL